jgi:2-polyprenyl-6-methoxyphenol hydroxylase-like FAD-dependent oxidoreductase
MSAVRDHAVVLGASIAGLLAARVLSDAYAQVTILERDALPSSRSARRGVPQAQHLHGLQPRGMRILDEFFPGLTSNLVSHGAVSGDALGTSRFHLSGHRIGQTHLGLPVVMASRPFLEGHLRDRVGDLPAVTLHPRTAAGGFTTDPDHRRVTGVRTHDLESGAERDLPADLVVDATGRGSRTPAWLAGLGYRPPAADRVEVGLTYTSRLYRLRPGALGGDIGVLTGGTPEHPRGGALAAVENDRHLLTLYGILGDSPPTDPEGFVAYAGSLSFPDIAEALRGAEPLTAPTRFRFPGSVRYRYERLRDFPAGLLVLGDAACSFNPIYAQGMTVAAMQAAALRDLLAARGPLGHRRYFRALARTVDTPWTMGVGADLAHRGVRGTRTPAIRLGHHYLPRLHAAAAHDPVVARAFVRVMGMLDPPSALFHPALLLRVLRVRPALASLL